MCTIQFVWRDEGYVYAGTIRTWIRTQDMMGDVLNMVNFVVDSHSMSDALDTYNSSFRGRSSYSIASSSGNKLHDPPIQNPGNQMPKDLHAHYCSPISRAGLCFKHILRRNQVKRASHRVRIHHLVHVRF